MSLSPSSRSQIAPFIVMDVMDDAAQVEASGHDVIHLEVGQPGTGAPSRVIQAAHQLLDTDALRYTLAQGDPELRRAVAKHYQATYALSVEPDDICVTTGASGAFSLAFLACFESGDSVVTARPGYPCYRNILQSLGLRPVELDVDETTGYQLTLEAILSLDEKPKGVIIASPANPTGSVLTPQALRTLVSGLDQAGITVIVDEIYHGLTYGGVETTTAAGMGERVLVINSFSKYFSMTGWRLGWVVAPPELRRTMETLSQNFVICPPTLSQRAALEAFNCHDELAAHVTRYAENRDILLAALQDVGITKMAPADGAFYIYADFSEFTNDSRAFCKKMLEEIHVATTPGIDFDPIRGKHMVRLSYCVSTDDVKRAANRLKNYLLSP